MAEGMIRCEETDPNRCQAVTQKGQCIFLSMPGLKNCPIHAGASKVAQKTEQRNNYRLTLWQARIEEKKQSPDLKNLRDEIAIMRMLLEERLNMCQTSTDLLLHSGAISDIAQKIEKLVASCHKLEEKMGMVLDKQQILDFASSIINIVGEELKGHEEVVERISNRVLIQIGDLGNKELRDESSECNS